MKYKSLKEAALRELNEDIEDEIDSLYHQIKTSPQFEREMAIIANRLATKVAEAAFYAKAYNEPEKLNEPIDGIGEFVTKRIMNIARKIIGMESKSVDFEPPGSAWYGREAKRRALMNDPYGPFKNPLNHNYPKDLY